MHPLPLSRVSHARLRSIPLGEQVNGPLRHLTAPAYVQLALCPTFHFYTKIAQQSIEPSEGELIDKHQHATQTKNPDCFSHRLLYAWLAESDVYVL